MTASNEADDRKTAIHLLRSGHSAPEIAKTLNRSVGWVYKWQTRFKQEGWRGLQSRSRAPHQHGRRLKAEVRQAIVQARSQIEVEAVEGRRLKYKGAPSVQSHLDQQKVNPLPSLSSIQRVMRAAGMTRPSLTQSQLKVMYPHLQPSQPHYLIQVDIVPHYLQGGEEVACFNAIDVVSRYPTGQALAQRRAQDAVAFLIHVWQVIGLAYYTQVDNEGCFSGGFSHKGVLGQVLRLALWVGTELVFSPVYHPESNGTVERFHQDYDDHVWQHHLQDRTEVNEQGTNFFQKYRQSYHHSALKGQSPAQVHYRQPPSRLSADFTLPLGKVPLTVGRVHFIRRVSPAGTVSVLNLVWSVPEPDPTKGVWVTLEFTLTGATLQIFDAAPDASQRTCLATYPFPLTEKVQPKPTLLEIARPLQRLGKVMTYPIQTLVKMAAHFLTIY
jgi:hypothetical protein